MVYTYDPSGYPLFVYQNINKSVWNKRVLVWPKHVITETKIYPQYIHTNIEYFSSIVLPFICWSVFSSLFCLFVFFCLCLLFHAFIRFYSRVSIVLDMERRSANKDGGKKRRYFISSFSDQWERTAIFPATNHRPVVGRLCRSYY